MLPRTNIYIIQILLVIIIFCTLFQWTVLFKDTTYYKVLYNNTINKYEVDSDIVLNNSKFGEVLSEKKRERLFFAMKSIHDVFEERGIWYVISFGTLLGAVRHWDKIPWDDDMDIIVRRIDLPKIREALKDLEELGLRTGETWKLFKVYGDDTDELFIDIFVIDVDEDDNAIRCFTKSNKKCIELSKPNDWWHKWWGFPNKYLRERKVYVFGDLKLWGPKNSLELLQFWYGKNVLTECSTPIYDHHTGKYLNPIVVKCPSNYPSSQL